MKGEIDISREGVGLSVFFSFDEILAPWKKLVDRNAKNRALDDVYYRDVHHERSCPRCHAHPVNQTLIDDKYIWRACRKCDFRFLKT